MITGGLIERAAHYLADSRYAIALTGAGMSTESGIPDFRGPSGVWTKDPEAEARAYRSYDLFISDPEQWWRQRLTMPGPLSGMDAAAPNSGHYALAEMEDAGVLKCLITQNIDGLHEKAGTRRLLEYHGSVLKLRCLGCGARFARDRFDLDALLAEEKLPPLCPACGGILKTDTVMFGEPIPPDVAGESQEEATKCDVMLICGTSAVVYPFASLPRIAREYSVSGSRPVIIEVNAEPTPLTAEGISDYLIQGKTGEVLPELAALVKKARRAPG